MKLYIPNPLTLMMSVIIIASISTWFLPAGQYAKLSNNNNDNFVITSSKGTQTLAFTQQSLDSLGIKIELQKFVSGDIRKPISVPDTYVREKSRPQGFVSIMQAPIKGIMDSIDIVLVILVIGGFMSIFNKTGALMNGIRYLSVSMKGRERLLIVILTFIFSFLGGSYGMDVEAIVFYPVLVPLFLAAGYDILVPLAIVFGGTNVGFISSFSNPFSVIIASNAAGLNWMDGFYERILFFILGTTFLIWYILRYAAKVKKDPSSSLVLKIDGIVESPFAYDDHIDSNKIKLATKTKCLLLVFVLTFISMIVGIVFYNWWTTEMSALFFGSAILVAFIDRIEEKLFIKEFVYGMEGLLSVALIVGLARGVTIVLNEGLVGDSILYYASNVVSHLPPSIFILFLMMFYFFFAVLVSSSSGMAVLTMPIIAALAIIVNIPGREIVNAYLFGIGSMFLISPTGSIFPALTMVNVSYKVWIKFVMPLLLGLLVLGALFLVIGIHF